MRKRAISLYSHAGGVAAGARAHGIDTVMYTTNNVFMKSLLQHKMAAGQLTEGPIHRFSQSINTEETAEARADVVLALVREDIYQSREHRIPNERGLFTLETHPRGPEDAAQTHKKTLYEIALICVGASASVIYAFFTYDPTGHNSMDILVKMGFKVRVYEFACVGPLNVSPYIYCLVAHVEGDPVEEYVWEERRAPLVVSPLLQTPVTNDAVTSSMILIQSIVLWDIAPCIVSQMLKTVLEDKEEYGSRVTLIKTTVSSADSVVWDYNRLTPGNIYDLTRQPVSNPLQAARLIGWPQDWAPGLLY